MTEIRSDFLGSEIASAAETVVLFSNYVFERGQECRY